MKKTLKKGFMIGIGALSLTTKAIENVLTQVERKSRISKNESEKLVKDMLKEANKQATKIGKYVEKEIKKQIKKVRPALKRFKRK
ncbi:MAG TPA: hypothetical protein VJH97_03190 [Candidatus Nanoarchaeia archaeon]|nr:hypothetical protein [Candidatus Nanoarchaeia archaeon]